jgi:hypothetical protein
MTSLDAEPSKTFERTFRIKPRVAWRRVTFADQSHGPPSAALERDDQALVQHDFEHRGDGGQCDVALQKECGADLPSSAGPAAQRTRRISSFAIGRLLVLGSCHGRSALR